jgi:hypothetical protein
MNRYRVIRSFSRSPESESRSPAADGGSVYVEFILAIVPMLSLFWGIMQLNGILLADLVARHAAVNAVRAAIVCDSQKGHVQEGEQLGRPGGCAYEAARATLSAVKSFGDPPEFEVEVQGAEETGNEPVTATVIAKYRCQVPLAAAFMCNGWVGGEGGGESPAGTIALSRKATLPNQGASYELK